MQGKRRNRASVTSLCSAAAAAADDKERSRSSSTTKPYDSTHDKVKTAKESAHTISHTLKTSRGINKCIQGQGGKYELKQPLENALTQGQAHGLAYFHTVALNAAAAPTSTAQDATQLTPPAAASLSQPNVLQPLLIAAAQAQSQNSSTSNANPSPHIHAAALQMALQNNDQFLDGLINNVAQTHGIQAAIQLFSQLALLNTNTTSLSNEVVPNLENSNAVFPQAQANLMPAAQQSVQNQLDMLLEQSQQQNREQERQRQLQLLSQLLEQELKKQLDRK
jgi:hypothetical protein